MAAWALAGLSLRLHHVMSRGRDDHAVVVLVIGASRSSVVSPSSIRNRQHRIVRGQAAGGLISSRKVVPTGTVTVAGLRTAPASVTVFSMTGPTFPCRSDVHQRLDVVDDDPDVSGCPRRINRPVMV